MQDVSALFHSLSKTLEIIEVRSLNLVQVYNSISKIFKIAMKRSIHVINIAISVTVDTMAIA